MKNTKPKTIDEVCGKPEGSFAKAITQKTARLKQLEQKRQERILAARAPKEMAWAV